jgi:hypothetical protein
MRNCLISEGTYKKFSYYIQHCIHGKYIFFSTGGSGVEIHRESYQKSVDYWSKNCELK